MQAAREYDPDKNDNFEAFARPRIRFAVKDGFRQRDHLSRCHRRTLKDDAPQVMALSDCHEHEQPATNDKGLAWVEDRDLVQRLIGGLPLYLRRVIYLRFWRDMTLHEIARRLDISVPTAGNHLKKAVQAMKARAAVL